MVRVVIDSQKCVGHLYCVGQLPEVFDYDEETETAIVVSGELQDDQLADVRLAASLCPVGAVVIEA